MWTCYLCHSFHVRNLKDLVSRTNTVHSAQPNVNISCKVDRCSSCCKSWYNHVIKVHKNIYNSDGGNSSGDQAGVFTLEGDISCTACVDADINIGDNDD